MQHARPLILLLEDDAVAADALQLILSDWGADVVHGADAAQLMSNAGDKADHANMIITDFNLGDGHNGVSTVKALRRRSPNARVLVMSGSIDNEARTAAERAGYAFLQKPAPSADIIAWLETA
jgi:DNA-binding NtrC family response regulator